MSGPILNALDAIKREIMGREPRLAEIVARDAATELIWTLVDVVATRGREQALAGLRALAATPPPPLTLDLEELREETDRAIEARERDE